MMASRTRKGMFLVMCREKEGGMEWVVRGGIASPPQLVNGYGRHAALVTPLYGFSVQYQPGKTIEELALAGQFRNRQISYADDDALQAAVQSVGYTMQLVKSPGRGFHHTFAVIYTQDGTMPLSLPLVVAQALSQAFRFMPNPFPSP
jgi:hypothetical protein